MFKTWKKKRALKRMQEDCFHEYSIVSTYQVDSGKYSYKYDWVDRHDMYCPICEHMLYRMSNLKANRQIKMQELRESHKGH